VPAKCSFKPNDGHAKGRLRVTSDPPKGKLRGTSDPPTSCIYRGSKGHISKDRVLIIDLYDPGLPIDDKRPKGAAACLGGK